MSRIDNRRWPRAAGPSTKNPWSSGPRCTRMSVIRRTASGSGRASNRISPAMPHMISPFAPRVRGSRNPLPGHAGGIGFGLAFPVAQTRRERGIDALGDQVGALVLRFVVGPDHQFRKQTHEDAQDPHQREKDREKRERRFDEVLETKQLVAKRGRENGEGGEQRNR